MSKNNYIIPEQCMKCGSVFDLWYDLSEAESNPYNEEIQEKLGRKLSEYLCWDCKKQIIIKISKSEEDAENSSDEDLFLDWDIE